MSDSRIKKIISEIITLTGCTLTCKHVLKVVQRLKSVPSTAIPCELNSLAVDLSRKASDPNSFQETFRELQSQQLPILSEYVQLLGLLTHLQKPSLPLDSDKSNNHGESPCGQLCVRDLVFKLQAKAVSIRHTRTELNRKEVRPAIGEWSVSRTSSIVVYKPDPLEPLFQDSGENQERQLIEDLISCFLGFNGSYISSNETYSSCEKKKYTIDGVVDMKFRCLLEIVLPLGSYYTTAVNFIEERKKMDEGRVNQSLGAAIGEELHSFREAVVNIEQEHIMGIIDLNTICNKVRPYLPVMQRISDVITEVNKDNSRGGKTLSILHSFASRYIHDSQVKNMLMRLIRAASIPYFQSLTMWINHGILFDPFREFMIRTRSGRYPQNNGPTYAEDYWNRRFELQPENVPNFLDQIKDVIYRAGRCRDVINRILDIPIPGCFEPDMRYDLQTSAYSQKIFEAFSSATYELKSILNNTHDVMGWLNSARVIYFLEPGQLFFGIIEECGYELNKDVKSIRSDHLASLVEIALEVTHASVSYIDSVKLVLREDSILDQVKKLCYGKCPKSSRTVTGFEGFCLSLEVKWPISLIISPKDQLCYQLIFRLIFYSKYILRKLELIKLRDLPVFVCLLRFKMIAFMQGILHYIFSDNLTTQWIKFWKQTQQSFCADKMQSTHSNYLYSCVVGCFLADPSILGHYFTLLDVISNFTENLGGMTRLEAKEIDGQFSQGVRNLLGSVKKLPKTGQCDLAYCINMRTNINEHYMEFDSSSPLLFCTSPTIGRQPSTFQAHSMSDQST